MSDAGIQLDLGINRSCRYDRERSIFILLPIYDDAFGYVVYNMFMKHIFDMIMI